MPLTPPHSIPDIKSASAVGSGDTRLNKPTELRPTHRCCLCAGRAAHGVVELQIGTKFETVQKLSRHEIQTILSILVSYWTLLSPSVLTQIGVKGAVSGVRCSTAEAEAAAAAAYD